MSIIRKMTNIDDIKLRVTREDEQLNFLTYCEKRAVPIFQSNNNKKRSHTQLDSRKQVIAFQDRVITINIKEAQHPLK